MNIDIPKIKKNIFSLATMLAIQLISTPSFLLAQSQSNTIGNNNNNNNNIDSTQLMLLPDQKLIPESESSYPFMITSAYLNGLTEDLELIKKVRGSSIGFDDMRDVIEKYPVLVVPNSKVWWLEDLFNEVTEEDGNVVGLSSPVFPNILVTPSEIMTNLALRPPNYISSEWHQGGASRIFINPEGKRIMFSSEYGITGLEKDLQRAEQLHNKNFGINWELPYSSLSEEEKIVRLELYSKFFNLDKIVGVPLDFHIDTSISPQIGNKVFISVPDLVGIDPLPIGEDGFVPNPEDNILEYIQSLTEGKIDPNYKQKLGFGGTGTTEEQAIKYEINSANIRFETAQKLQENGFDVKWVPESRITGVWTYKVLPTNTEIYKNPDTGEMTVFVQASVVYNIYRPEEMDPDGKNFIDYGGKVVDIRNIKDIDPALVEQHRKYMELIYSSLAGQPVEIAFIIISDGKGEGGIDCAAVRIYREDFNKLQQN
jgi:hypothetical protein